ncbi:hypothetical protein [Acaryochloris marina]|uniref:hypothetical protein n=1 Tax=Acaryochloris marina TaxID=155978 RepID=UPI0021C3B61E|nr:hypothetical protein [Acaryochloris marina]
MTISNDQITSALATSSSEQPVDGDQHSNEGVLVNASPNEEVDLNTLNKIRDLLFGQQVHSQEQKLDQLENRLNQECADIRDQMDQRLQALETAIRNDLQTLAQIVQSNHASQTTSVSDLEATYQSGISTVSGQLRELGEEVERQRLSILSTLEEKVTSLGTDFNHRHAELKALLEREVQSLQSVDAQDRDQLADLFSQLALNIRSNS